MWTNEIWMHLWSNPAVVVFGSSVYAHQENMIFLEFDLESSKYLKIEPSPRRWMDGWKKIDLQAISESWIEVYQKLKTLGWHCKNKFTLALFLEDKFCYIEFFSEAENRETISVQRIVCWRSWVHTMKHIEAHKHNRIHFLQTNIWGISFRVGNRRFDRWGRRLPASPTMHV